MQQSNLGFAQVGALIVGVAYLLAGIVGFFITGFGNFVTNTGDTLIGFDINPFHNVFHFAVGAYLILVSQLGRTATEGALIGGGVVYLLAAFLGFENRLQIISINEALASDQFLHIVSGSAALLLGVFSAASANRAERTSQTIQQR